METPKKKALFINQHVLFKNNPVGFPSRKIVFWTMIETQLPPVTSFATKYTSLALVYSIYIGSCAIFDSENVFVIRVRGSSIPVCCSRHCTTSAPEFPIVIYKIEYRPQCIIEKCIRFSSSYSAAECLHIHLYSNFNLTSARFLD